MAWKHYRKDNKRTEGKMKLFVCIFDMVDTLLGLLKKTEGIGPMVFFLQSHARLKIKHPKQVDG